VKVQVVTDSTCDLSQSQVEKLDIKIVPIHIRFGSRTYRDGVDINNEQFYAMLEKSPEHPATSQPNTEDFLTVYREGYRKCSGIVSIHVSSRISGVFNSAILARKSLETDCPIEVIDSKFNSAGLGLVVTAAGRMAQTGAGILEVVAEAHRAIREVCMFGIFETTKYLARSGRVNKTIAAASRILHVMPLLTFHDGEIVRAGLVRAVSKGMERILVFVNHNSPVKEIVIAHSQVADQAEQLKKRLGEFVADEKISIVELGAGLGVHGGPGVLLAAVRRDMSNTLEEGR
jgi:DegV family protein with EDD domain